MESATAPEGNVISLTDRAMARCEKREASFVPQGFNATGTCPGIEISLEDQIDLLGGFLTVAAKRLSEKAIKGGDNDSTAALILRCARMAKVIGQEADKLEQRLAKAKRKAKRH